MHVEQVVRFGEPCRFQQRLQFFRDQPLELRAGVEVVDDAALGAHQMVMMVAGQGLGDLESIGAIGTSDANGDTGVTEFSEISVCGRQWHTRDLGNFVRGDRTI